MGSIMTLHFLNTQSQVCYRIIHGSGAEADGSGLFIGAGASEARVRSESEPQLATIEDGDRVNFSQLELGKQKHA